MPGSDGMIRKTFLAIIAAGVSAAGIFFLGEKSIEAACLPPRHWSYDALERLGAVGLVDPAAISSRPLDRYRAAEAVVQTVRRIRAEEVTDVPGAAVLEELILKLMRELEAEISELAPELAGEERTEPRRYRFRAGLEKSLDYAVFTHPQTYSPPNRQGRRLYEGMNAEASLAGSFFAGKDLDFTFEPVFYHSKRENELIVRQAWAGGNLKRFRLQAGRFPLWYGPGYHGSLLLSDNARPPLTMEIENQQPCSVSVRGHRLGKWNGSLFLSRLEEERDLTRPCFSGARGEFFPFRWLGLGATHTVIFGGKEAGGLSFGSWYDAVTGKDAGEAGDLNDHLTAFDAQFIPPPAWQRYLFFSQGLKIYGELGAEDNLPGFLHFRDFAYLAGIYLPGIFQLESTDLRLEFARTDVDWYTHGTYRSGYTYRGDVLGHHLGGDGRDYFLEVSQRFSENVGLKVSLDREERFRSEPAGETRNEVGLDLSCELDRNREFHAGYTFVDISRSRAAGGQDNNLHIFSLSGSYRF